MTPRPGHLYAATTSGAVATFSLSSAGARGADRRRDDADIVDDGRNVERGDSADYRVATSDREGARMNPVSKILGEKTGELLKIDGGAPVIDAVKRMVDANVGSLLVTEDDDIVGIVTERDYLRRVALEGRDENEAAVSEIMSAPLVVVSPETTIEECMALMTERRIRHLPVVEGDEVVGLVSIGDLVKFTSKQQSFEIQYLTNYITTAG